MRVSYIPPDTSQFDVLFQLNNDSVRGAGIKDIITYSPQSHYQKGGSLLGVLSRVFQRTIPFFKNLIIPEIGNFTKNVADEYSTGVPLRHSLKRQGIKSVKNIGRKIILERGKK